jgi:RNA polymerase sigma factor (sigma-70 family)
MRLDGLAAVISELALPRLSRPGFPHRVPYLSREIRNSSPPPGGKSGHVNHFPGLASRLHRLSTEVRSTMPRESIGMDVLRLAQKVVSLVRRGCPIRPRTGSSGGRVWVSPADQADVIQEVFVKALATGGSERCDRGREYEPYLLMIARNTMIDWVRRQAASRARLRRLPSGDAEAAGGGDGCPPWYDDRNVAIAEQYVNGLSDELREVYRLRYAEGLSQDGTARAMGISRQNLRTLERRLRCGLTRRLAAAE